MVKGPGPIDKRFADGGTPTTYPADGTSFLLPLAPPYDKATIVTCGATWAYFKPGGVKHALSSYIPKDGLLLVRRFTPKRMYLVSSMLTGETETFKVDTRSTRCLGACVLMQWLRIQTV